MNSANTLCNSSEYPFLFHLKPYHCHHHTTTKISCSFKNRRRPNKPHTNKPKNPTNIEMVIDIERIKTDTSSTINTAFSRVNEQLGLPQFIDSGKDAFTDLQTLISYDSNRGIIVSCRQSSVMFIGKLVLLSCVIVFGFRVLIKIGLGIRNRIGLGFGHGNVVVRRDRSLGGKQVVVSKMNNPVARYNRGTTVSALESVKSRGKNRIQREERLPEWWPVLLPGSSLIMDREENQNKADRFIRAIMDNRMRGQDIIEDDIIQLRRMCRTSGVRVYIDTGNVRNSIYRAAVDFVLNTCISALSETTCVQIDGEDARHFVAGLADNIGLDYIRAARMVSASVAARTRSYILQAWALEMQGKHSEAMVEILKLCSIHRTFPPEESSPEMEMVARGLEKHLKLDQREFLMKMLLGVCDEHGRKSAAEALGLVQ